MKISNLLLLTCLCFTLLTSCSGVKYINFTNKDNDVYSSVKLKDFLKDNNSPKVVLRVPSNSKSEVTSSESKSHLYDVVEKELIKNGFIVRDRQLFNQVLTNTSSTDDYSVLKEKTDTDLIIELSKFNSEVIYETNKYVTEKGKNGILDYKYKRYGAEVEFKVIMIKNNELAGTYTFNYSPCGYSPCVIDSKFKSDWKKIVKNKVGYEGVEMDELSVFMKKITNDLVENMRK